jgi:beta-lactamase regulating signal transducer with metallopeptidase domain
MRPALLVFVYAVAVAWSVPTLLAGLTRSGNSPRVGLAAWLVAMASVLASLVVTLQYLIRAAVAGWPGLAEVVCRSVTGGACTAVVYRSAVFEVGLGLLAVAAALTAVVLAWRYGRSVQRAQRQTRAHADAARIIGRKLLGADATVVLDAPQPTAYCVPGRPATIVLTSGALAVLDRAQLTAVLAHERAHLAGRHHLLIALTRGLAASFPAVPLFSQGPAEVTRLTEMCADDTAARHSGCRTLVAALLAMGTGMGVPAAALAVTSCAVTARVQRLLEPAPLPRHARNQLALITVILLLSLTTGLLTRFAGPLTAHGITAG